MKEIYRIFEGHIIPNRAGQKARTAFVSAEVEDGNKVYDVGCELNGRILDALLSERDMNEVITMLKVAYHLGRLDAGRLDHYSPGEMCK